MAAWAGSASLEKDYFVPLTLTNETCPSTAEWHRLTSFQV
jgi:hypothetical protein